MSLALASALAGAPAPLADFQALAAKHHASLTLQTYPTSVAEVEARTAAAIKDADAALAVVLALEPDRRDFARTFAALDAINAAVGDVGLVLGTWPP